MTADEIVRRGQEALQRLSRSYDDWMDIAEALAVGRAEVMTAIYTNKPTGKRYAKAMGEWLLARSFHRINEGTRKRLLDCLKHRVEIEKWRATVTEGERFSFNHPDTVLRKWKTATAVPDPNAPPRTSVMAKLKEANVEWRRSCTAPKKSSLAVAAICGRRKIRPRILPSSCSASSCPARPKRSLVRSCRS